MSYLRVPYYVWDDGEAMHVDGVRMELAWFDAIVAMRWAQLSEDEQAAAIAKAIEFGEFGADELREQQGVETQTGALGRIFGWEPE